MLSLESSIKHVIIITFIVTFVINNYAFALNL
jgi:hypothetical protein